MSQQPYGPPPQLQPPAPQPRPRPVGGLVIAITLALVAGILLNMVNITQWQALRGDVRELTISEAADRLVQLSALGWVDTLLVWGTAVIWIVILLRMRGNIELRTPGMLQWKKETLVALFVVPVVLGLASAVLPALFIPATLVRLASDVALIIVVNEIWRLGHPRRPGPTSVLVIVWGVVGILDELFFTLASQWWYGEMLDMAFDREAGGDRELVSTDFIPVSNAMSVACILDALMCVVAILMVWRLATKHNEGLRTP
ncbi:hypothetical protein [Microtetraspora malaysiensis]|uniref:hypothetical protein n=1 Tax=Microtetraspora malaysiensis TaxID=161358 RepID=UPI003D9255F5